MLRSSTPSGHSTNPNERMSYSTEGNGLNAIGCGVRFDSFPARKASIDRSPCIYEPAYKDRSGRGRPTGPRSQETGRDGAGETLHRRVSEIALVENTSTIPGTHVEHTDARTSHGSVASANTRRSPQSAIKRASLGPSPLPFGRCPIRHELALDRVPNQ
jgi:hypothetical protein